jgi:carboxylesterase
MTFKAEAATSKALRAGPDNDTLRALSSLYRQGSLGDAAGVRPGVIDVCRRAKFDAGSRTKARHASNPWPTT